MTNAEEAVAEVGALTTLEQVFRWAVRRSPRLMPHDVVVQDEYTHDVIFLAPDQSCLVFDATWLGAISGVSVWDHPPTPDELLHQRLQRGWTPTASELQSGPAVLGHAACVVTKG